jgi:peptidoglycan/xylan/chitin deacetylase (PgdA/CDA1 family)
MIAALLTTAALGGATGLGYSAMVPRSQWFGPTFTGGAAAARQIALTYDDGPNDRQTPELLETLDKHGVKATFFMVGRYVNLHPKVAEAVARAGHAVGNHTYTHPNLIFCSRTQIRAQLEECERALSGAVGEHSRLFRPPFGARRPQVLRVARHLGLTTVMWSITGYDWNANPADKIAAHVVRRAHGGDVILMHDGGHLACGADRKHTVMATERIIQRCRDLGFAFVTVQKMMTTEAPVPIKLG